MNIRELRSPQEYAPTAHIRYNVLYLTPFQQDWAVESRMIKWDERGREISTPRSSEIMDKRRLNQLQLFWQAQNFVLVARCKLDDSEVLFYENREDHQRLEAQSATTVPALLEVWICPNRDMAFKCVVPKALAFSVRSPDELAQKDIGYTELEVKERRGTVTAKVYWLNGQPSADVQTRWRPVIGRKVREYLQTNPGQSGNVFVKGILEDSLRQGEDARDLIMAKIDLAARLARLKAKGYQPMEENS